MRTNSASGWIPQHFGWKVESQVATVTPNRPGRKNPLTFESYAELRDTFHALRHVHDVCAVVVTGAGDNFCSGGSVCMQTDDFRRAYEAIAARQSPRFEGN